MKSTLRYSVEKLHAEKNVISRNRDVKLMKQKQSRKNWIYILYTHWVVEMEDVTLVNNVTLCMNMTRHNVVVQRGTVHKELLAT